MFIYGIIDKVQSASSMRIEKVDTAFCKGGEGPLWDPTERALYFIDNFGKKAHRYHPATGETQTWDMPDSWKRCFGRLAAGEHLHLQ